MDNWFKLVTAFGAGGIITKLLDIFILQNLTYKQNKKEWLREKKLKAYTNLIAVIKSYGINNIKLEKINIIKAKIVVSEAILLSDNDKLVEKIENYLEHLQKLHKRLEDDLIKQNIDPSMVKDVKKQEMLKYIEENTGIKAVSNSIIKELRKEIKNL